MSANTLLTLTMITPETLVVLENSCTFTRTINRQYSNEFAQKEAKIGATVNIRRPPQYTVSRGPALNVQPINDSSIPLTIGYQDHIDTTLSTADMSLSLQSFSEQIARPIMADLANKIDFQLMQIATLGTANYYGAPGSNAISFNSFVQANAILQNEASPRSPRFGILDPITSADLADNLKGLMNPGLFISDVFETGQFYGNVGGLNMLMDQNVQQLTGGVYAGTPVVTGPVGITSGWAYSSVVPVTGYTSSSTTINAGDIVTFGTGSATVYPVNPKNRQRYGSAPRPFVVLNTVSDVSGALSLTVFPAVISGGQFQNVTQAIPNNAAVVSIATTGQVYTNCLAYHRDAYAIAFVDLPIVGGTDMCVRKVDKQTGISLRVVRQYTITDDALPTRFDVLYGGAAIRGETACRVLL